MELLLVGSLFTLGKYLNKTDEHRDVKKKYSAVSENEKPSGQNIYDNNRYVKTKYNLQDLANKRHIQSEDFGRTKIVPNFYNQYTLQTQKYLSDLEIQKKDFLYNKSKNNVESSLLEQGKLLEEQYNKELLGSNKHLECNKSELLDKPVQNYDIFMNSEDIDKPRTLTPHNNMIPFFGANVRQNIDDNIQQDTKLENFTGIFKNIRHKRERVAERPIKGLTNVYGSPSMDYHLDRFRYNTSILKTNETPIEKIRVGPGLNKGFRAQGSDGFHSLYRVRPKDVDDLRVNKKLVYPGRVKVGKNIVDKRGASRNISKNRPDTFYKNSPAKYFTTVASIVGQTARDKYNMRRTLKDETLHSARKTNVTGYNNKSKAYDPSDIARRTIKETTLCPTKLSNAVGSNQSSVAYDPLDIARRTIKETTLCPTKISNAIGSKQNSVAYNPSDIARRTVKETTLCPTKLSNTRGSYQNSAAYDPSDIARRTVKETTLCPTKLSNTVGSYQNSVAYDPSDIARRTMKETTLHQTLLNNTRGSYQNSIAYDPSDIARRTMKETTLHQTLLNNTRGSYQNSIAYDPSDIARRTVKETTLCPTKLTNTRGSKQSSIAYDSSDIARRTVKETTLCPTKLNNTRGSKKSSIAYDPSDIARRTVKETTLCPTKLNNTRGSKQSSIAYDPDDIARRTVKETTLCPTKLNNTRGSKQSSIAYDPDDVARRTVKETTLCPTKISNTRGSKQSSVAYDPDDVARRTVKETTLHQTLLNNTRGSKQGSVAYDPDDIARRTQKEELSNIPYTSTAKGQIRTQVYDAMYNAETNVEKEIVASGRHPTLNNVKNNIDKEFINLSHVTDTSYKNLRDYQRTKIYNNVPNTNLISHVRTKETPLDLERLQIDDSILDAFRSNPYTKSLQSYA